jgi:hypothetical protein
MPSTAIASDHILPRFISDLFSRNVFASKSLNFFDRGLGSQRGVLTKSQLVMFPSDPEGEDTGGENITNDEEENQC